MDRKKTEHEPITTDLENEGPLAEPVDTDSTDEADADASGDSDDERDDENEAVRSGRE